MIGVHAAAAVLLKKKACPIRFLSQKMHTSVLDRNRFTKRRGIPLAFKSLYVLWAKLHGEVAAAISARVARVPLVWEPKHRQRQRCAHYR